MKRLLLFACLLLHCLIYYSQKSQVLNPSGYTHNYVLSDLKCIEDRKDTTRLIYIAGLRMNFTSNQEELSVMDFMRVKARELGADCYYPISYYETKNMGEVVVRLFFGGQKFLKDNEGKKCLNRFFIFNETHVAGDTAVFYLNGKQEAFDAQKVYTRPLALNEQCTVAINEHSITATKIVFRKAKKARFFILPENKKSIVSGPPRILGIRVNSLLINARANTLYEMSYDWGRLWLELYK